MEPPSSVTSSPERRGSCQDSLDLIVHSYLQEFARWDSER